MTAELMPIQGYDYIEYYVGNARQAAYYYGKAFGFSVVAYAGPETGVRDRVSYVLEQNAIRLVITGATRAESDVARHQYFHGDGIKDVAFTVPDAEGAYRVALERGAKSVRQPGVDEDEHGKLVSASIQAYGETIHTFVDRSNYSGAFAPGFVARD
ncbi:MAG: 4-hydroxyphenylpyruvate dioxygenase, partial [Actinobacteria bacterium]|nr:4-hydroxyphenylpyruvate dioxygenase [Actinomycetota bacterium]